MMNENKNWWIFGGVGLLLTAIFMSRDKIPTLSPSGRPWPTLVESGGKIAYGAKTTHRTFNVPTEHRKWAEAARRIARKYGLPESGVLMQYHYESRFHPSIESRVGAQGVAQLMPKAAISQGVMTGVSSSQRKEYGRQYDAGKAHAAEGRRRYPKAHKDDEPHPERKRMKREGYKMRLEASRWLAGQPGVVDRRTNPVASMEAGARMMKDLYKKYGDYSIAAGAYNWGPGNMDKALRGKSSVPEGPQKYMAAIAPYYRSEPKPELVSAEIRARYPWPAPVA